MPGTEPVLRTGGALRRLLSFAALLLAAGAAVAQQTCPPAPETPPLAVARVTDGDTLRLEDGRRVRLLGINAPEVAHGRNPAERGGEAARQALHELIRQAGNRVRLAYGPDRRDRHGRTLAWVWVAEQEAGLHLVRAGLALQVVLPPNTAHADCYRAAERQARAAGRGLWRTSPLIRAAELERSRGFALLGGTITRVREPAGHLVLELDGRVELFIHRDDRARFALPQPLTGLTGQAVEARGWLYDYRGTPNLRIDSPAMLRLPAADTAP